MVNETSDRPRLTPKGARTRVRIVQEAAALIHERLTAMLAKGREDNDWAGFAREISEAAGL